MPIHNADVAAVFEEIADLLELKGENPFRIRAYRNAARMILDLGQELRDMVGGGVPLTDLPGIGEDLARKIEEIVGTGKCRALEELRSESTPGILELLRLPGLGPKRVKLLNKQLGVANMEQLEAAARAGKIRDLPGFGEKSEKRLLEALQARALTGKRFLLAAVEPYAEALVAHLRKVAGVKETAVAGSYRRRKETVGDLDVLVVARQGNEVADAFTAYDEVHHVLAKGETKSSVLLRSGIQVDLRVVEAKSFGAALNYFTGSKAHNIAIRRLGQQRGLKINEYGVFRDDNYLAGRTEEEVYAAVDLPYIPPELREDTGEIEAAQKGQLPKLVSQENIRGDLHVHTSESDGQNTLEEMALAARARGYEYLAVTDHSKRLTVARGLDAKRLRKQMEEIDRINAKLKGCVILKGIEADILENGELDLPNEVLKDLDLVIGAVHSHFQLPEARQTERIMKAMDNPYFTMLAHPSGRLLLEREGYAVDMSRLLQHAKERGCFMELNSHPLRLDLDDSHCRAARDMGILICINTDAHSIAELNHVRFGVGQARRGWLEAKHVLNTRGLADVQTLLAKTRLA
jgi:DNA polymerase (family 10)